MVIFYQIFQENESQSHHHLQDVILYALPD